MTVIRVLTGLAVVVLAAAVGTIAVQERRSFTPYLAILLGAAPLAALAAGIATGGIRVVRSGEREHPVPEEDGLGSFLLPPFRPYRALRNAAAAALAVFASLGGIALVDYFGRTAEPSSGAALALLGWLFLLARLLWAVVKRTWVGARLEDGRLAIRPEYPRAGGTLHVAFDQAVRTDLWVRAVDLTLVAERLITRRVHGRVRSKTVRVARQRLRLPVESRAWPGTPIHVEGVFEVPSEAVAAGGFLSWRVEARTRMAGPDYVTRFPIGAPEEVDDDDDDDEDA